MFKSKEKQQDTNTNSGDYRAPSDTGSSDQPDVIAGADKNAVSASPGPHDADGKVDDGTSRTPKARFERLRAWGKQHRLRGPMDADWEEFEKLLGEP